MSKYFSEFFGTFTLIFFGTAAVALAEAPLPGAGSLAIPLAFGFAVFVLILVFGEHSGAHFNPAVSLGFFLSGRLSWKKLLLYVASQVAGGVAASYLVKTFYPSSLKLGATLPTLGWQTAFAAETLFTLILMLVILLVSSGHKEKGVAAAAAIGGIIFLEALVGGSLSGASMNPARSLAPAIFSGEFSGIWIYLSAPFVGAGLAVLMYRIFFEPDFVKFLRKRFKRFGKK